MHQGGRAVGVGGVRVCSGAQLALNRTVIAVPDRDKQVGGAGDRTDSCGQDDEHTRQADQRFHPQRVAVTVTFSYVNNEPSLATARSTYVPGSRKDTCTAHFPSA